MPIQKCQSEGKPGYKYGNTGKCYTYDAGDENSRRKALNKARAQERAIRASGYKEI